MAGDATPSGTGAGDDRPRAEPGLPCPAEPGAAGEYEPALDPVRVPWESPAGRSWRGWLATSRFVLAQPARFFHVLPRTGGAWRVPFGFAAGWVVVGALANAGGRALMAATGVDLSAALARWAATLAPGGRWPPGAAPGSAAGSGADLIPGAAAVEAWLAVPWRAVALDVSVGLVQLPLLALALAIGARLAGGRADRVVWRIVCYATAAQVLTLVPLVGWGLAGLLGVALVLSGLRYAGDLSLGRALLAVALPLCGAALLIVVPLVAATAALAWLGTRH